MALSLVTHLLTSLKPLVEKEVGLLWGVGKEMTKLSSTLSTIEAVLEDAERNHPEDRVVQDWLRKLKDAAYEVDDILDEYSTEILRWESKGQSSGSLKKVGTSLLYPFKNVKFRHRIGHMMKEISGKLAAIADERKNFHLHNMTLILDRCRHLKRLPNNMKCLRNLRHLHLSSCSLTEMPLEIGQLTCLKELSLFVVGTNKGCHLSELQHLNLGGVLRIEHLERVKNPMDAKEANLVGKHNLRVLILCWEDNHESESQENVEELLEALEPHPNIEKLVIENYYGTHLPSWMMDLKNIDLIELKNCKNCLKLPPIGQLPLLRRLSIWNMDKVNYIDDDLPDGGPVRGFPSLEVLMLDNLSSLKGLSRKEGKELFPLLRGMEITGCPNLSFRSLSSLKTLSVVRPCGTAVLESISTFESLTSLEVNGNDETICFPEEVLRNLTLLKSLSIRGFTKLKSFPNGLAHLKALKSLSITNCDELKSLPEEELRGLESLQHLSISHCEEFSSLSEGLQHLVCLESLEILWCPKLVALPEGVKHLKSLQRLQMGYSDALVALPETLQHVPALQYLCIFAYPKLTSLPDWLGNLTTLQTLLIYDCPKISLLPASIQRLTELRRLSISDCGPELARRCEKGKGEDWHKIAHIPQVEVDAPAKPKGHNSNIMAASSEVVAASVRMHCRRKLVGCSGGLKINRLE
ncbi:hypothetical protein RHGRI_012997 [Rhododendron griersonianum]|uniref:Rx N-terminal domain-containing protein n=1 Tax=Rhododendron griersonianum TaxID=479676 RepID=A0AAV6K412_9ERIC|nr:hypothetical protein RHGRI_012997 [Rhododendron griersonianum]